MTEPTIREQALATVPGYLDAVRQRDTLTRWVKEHGAAVPAGMEMRSELLSEALTSDDLSPDIGLRYLEHDRAMIAWNLTTTALRSALDGARVAPAIALAAGSEEGLTWLRQRLEAIVATTTELAPHVVGLTSGDAAIRRAAKTGGESARAWVALSKLAQEYGQIRACQGEIYAAAIKGNKASLYPHACIRNSLDYDDRMTRRRRALAGQIGKRHERGRAVSNYLAWLELSDEVTAAKTLELTGSPLVPVEVDVPTLLAHVAAGVWIPSVTVVQEVASHVDEALQEPVQHEGEHSAGRQVNGYARHLEAYAALTGEPSAGAPAYVPRTKNPTVVKRDGVPARPVIDRRTYDD